MKIDKFKKILFNVIIWGGIICPALFSYTNPFFSEHHFSGRKNNCHEIYANPAQFRHYYQNNLAQYKAGYDNAQNSFRRPYDPVSISNFGISIYQIRILDQKTMIAARVRYNQADYFKVHRSLEKNYYDHYFSYSDTTTGNTSYAGPRLFFLYNRQINSKLSLGIKTNYGIERGLKDKYTKCETIIINYDLCAGFDYRVWNSLSFGIFARYYSLNGKYEAVGDLQSALVTTSLGYHLLHREEPGTSVRKNDQYRGLEVGLELNRKDILINGLEICMQTKYSTRKTEVDVGSVQDAHRRGYWQRQGFQFVTALLYHLSEDHVAMGFSFEYQDIFDWCTPFKYQVVNLENRMRTGKCVAETTIPFQKKFWAILGGSLESVNYNYQEYTLKFDWSTKDLNKEIYTGFEFDINSINTVFTQISFSSIHPYFYWETDEFKIISASLGTERKFIFGSMGFEINYEKWLPANYHKTRQIVGFLVYFYR